MGQLKIDYSSQEQPTLFISEYLEAWTLLEIQKLLFLTGQKFQMSYGLVGLPQYYIFIGQAKKQKQCQNMKISSLFLGESYTDCKLCQGIYFDVQDENQMQYIQKSKRLKQDPVTKLYYFSHGLKIAPQIVAAFQRLWNCNFPDQKLTENGFIDNDTEIRLLRSPADGFPVICGGDSCETIQGCFKCPKDQSKCLECNKGFLNQGSFCVECPSDCQDCQIKEDDGTPYCKKCDKGFYLKLGFCTETCENYNPGDKWVKTQYACLECDLEGGEYTTDFECLPCSQFCQKCKSDKECTQCFDGFILQNYQCKIPDESSGCPIERCPEGSYRSLEKPYKCADCHYSCFRCTGPTSSDCVECRDKTRFEFINGMCVENDPPDFSKTDKEFDQTDLNKIDEIDKKQQENLRKQKAEEEQKRLDSMSDKEKEEYRKKQKEDKEALEQIKKEQVLSKYDDEEKAYELEQQKEAQLQESKERYCHFSCSTCSADTPDVELCDTCKIELKYYIAAEKGKIKCIDSCPQGYTELPDGDQVKIQCVKQQEGVSEEVLFMEQQENLKQRCAPGEYFDTVDKKCQRCARGCIQCSQSDQCDMCSMGFYWDANTQKCELCHFSCLKCQGKGHTQCLWCTDPKKVFPNNGICDGQAQTYNFKNDELMKSYQQVLDELKKKETSFKLPEGQDTYKQPFAKLFESGNSQWQNLTIAQLGQCNVTQFKKYVQSSDVFLQNCKDDEIRQSMLGDAKSQYTLIALSILAQHQALINNEPINPYDFVMYASQKGLFKYFYSKQLNSSAVSTASTPSNASCKEFLCQAVLDNSISGILTDRQNKLTYQQILEIDLNVNCFDNWITGPPQDKLLEVEQVLFNAKQSLRGQVRQYVMLQVCGRPITDQTMSYYLGVVTEYYGQGFYDVLFPAFNLGAQRQSFFIQGLDPQNNNRMKELDTNYKNEFLSYKIKSVKVVQVEDIEMNHNYQQVLTDNYRLQADAMDTKTKKIKKSKCACADLQEYIKGMENISSLQLLVNNKTSTVLTPSLDIKDISSILDSQFNIDLNNYRKNSVPFTDVQAKAFFDAYLKSKTQQVSEYYNFKVDQMPQCVINVLVDMLYVNKGIILDNENKTFGDLINNGKYKDLISEIKKHTFCSAYPVRCQKIEQVLTSCI